MSLRLFVGSFAVASLFTWIAEAKLARTGDAQVSFSATGPAGLSIVGTTSDLAITESEQEVVVTVPLRNLDTKIDLRNRHMREKYLEVAKFPNAELRVTKAAVSAPSGKGTAQLSLHGQTRPVTFTYATKEDAGATGVTASLHLSMLDFGIEKPGYAGISVKPDVDVNVAFKVKKD